MSRKRKNRLWLVVAALSVSLLAGVGAYKGSRLLADEITTDAESQAEKAGLFKPFGIEDEVSSRILKGERTVDKLHPLTLVYVVDYESGKIMDTALQVFDTVSMNVSFVDFDPDVTYTMTGTLYRSLSNGNVLVPQTVRLRELYGYYGNVTAFDAGRKIMSEMLGVDIDYYIALSVENVDKGLGLSRMTALGCKELYEERKGRKTSLTEDEDKAFEGLCEYLSDSDIIQYEAPVIKRNESCFVDVTGVWEILEKILPKE